MLDGSNIQNGISQSFSFMKISFIVGLIFVAIFTIFTVLLIFNPKLRAKLMGKGIKAQKYMIDEHKDDIKSINTNLAEASAESIEIKTRAIKKGFTTDDKIFCKYCGEKIDKDSKFCSKCGKEL